MGVQTLFTYDAYCPTHGVCAHAHGACLRCQAGPDVPVLDVPAVAPETVEPVRRRRSA
jgi:hypothetical protein